MEEALQVGRCGQQVVPWGPSCSSFRKRRTRHQGTVASRVAWKEELTEVELDIDGEGLAGAEVVTWVSVGDREHHLLGWGYQGRNSLGNGKR